MAWRSMIRARLKGTPITYDPDPLPDEETNPPGDSGPLDPESSFALVLRARTGDQAAIEQLVARYSRRLRK